jgi:hypothetical protein
MKIKQLLVLGGFLLMTGATANAELVNGVRQRPNVAKAEAFQVDTEYYLFNTGARMFFVGANDWNTRASVGTKGYKVKIQTADFAPDGAYEFTDCVETQNNEWKCVFSTNDAGAIWVDNSNETYRYWEFTEVDGKYRISNSDLATVADAASGAFLGWNGTDDTRLYFVKPTTEGVGVDWVFVTEETYNAWQETWASMKDQYDAAAELLTYLNSAKEQNINVATEQAIYENEAATVEELNAAAVAVQKKINDAQAGDATVDNPSDMTGSLINPNFDNASYAGWKGTAPNMTGDGNHANADVAEHFNKTFDTYQQLSNMPAGVYMLENTGFLRGWSDDYKNHTNYTAYLYTIADNDTMQVAMANPWEALNDVPMAGDTDFGTTAHEESGVIDGITYYIPNDPSAARLYFEKGYYKNKVLFAIEGDSVKLGVKKGVNRTNEWATFDNFKLTYYGKAAEAYQYYIDNAVAKKEYTDVNVSEQYLKVYEAAFNATVTNKAEAKAALAAIVAAEEAVEANIKVWNELKEMHEAGTQMAINNNELPTAGELSEYLSFTVEDETSITNEAEVKTDGADLTNDQLQVMIERIKELMAAVEKEAKQSLQPNQDVTEYMKNPDFNGNADGWTVVNNGGGNVHYSDGCYEAFHSTDFDVYQEVADLPQGVYEVEFNGYVRHDEQTTSFAEDLVSADVPIYVYMNDSRAYGFANWVSYPKDESFYKEDTEAGTGVKGASYTKDDATGNCYPNNMIAASAAFADGGYINKLKCIVSESGDVTRIGVKGMPEAKYWPIFDNFKLTYLGYEISVVKPLLEEKIAEAALLEDMMSAKDAKAALATAVKDAQDVLESTEKVVVFRATAKLDKAINEVKDGNAQCLALQAEAQTLYDYANGEGVESPKANEATTLAANILIGVERSDYNANELKEKSTEIKEMTLLMNLPENYAQGSAEGVDVTGFIQTPNFQKTKDGAEVNAIDGWHGTSGYNFGNDDTQKGALALEFYEKKFDMYQDLAGVGMVTLPKGNYSLQVNAFERVNAASPAYLYAVAGKDTLGIVELKNHGKGYIAEEGESAPNDMVSAVALFEKGRYLNVINFRFEGDTLRIGIKHENSNGTDWVIMDNFKLFFHGDDYTGVETVINLGKPVQVQYFTLDGRQVSAARKGLVIRKTIMDNGAVIVRKIQK